MTRFRRPRLASPSWLRLPRRTARLRLTLLSGALFLLSGATLLTVTYLLFAQTPRQRHEHAQAPPSSASAVRLGHRPQSHGSCEPPVASLGRPRRPSASPTSTTF